jgi:hypothetical protein
MISISPDTSRSVPSLKGLDVTESEWRLDISEYDQFIESATGIAVGKTPSAAECYRIGNRLEALIEDYQQTGEWERLQREYPAIESSDELVGLARFFRQCHDCRVEEHSSLVD